MASIGGPAEDILPELLNAKRVASAEFLSPSRPRPRAFAVAYSVSMEPRYNVVGVGMGYKQGAGDRTGDPVVRFYVERKVAEAAIPRRLRLPDNVEGVEAQVIEAGRFRAFRTSVPRFRQRLRPARPGCSVGFQFTGSRSRLVMAGTFGAVVDFRGKAHILSNNHVLAGENSLAIGSPIFQPGLLDHGDVRNDQIAALTKFIPLLDGAPNVVDCAIAEVIDPATVTSSFLPRIGALVSAVPIEPRQDMRVHKVGRMTGYTTGTVFDVSVDVNVEYEMGTIQFLDQILIRGRRGPFSAAGDSGSVIIDRDTRRPTALLIAGASTGIDDFTVANRLSDVMAQLAVTPVP